MTLRGRSKAGGTDIFCKIEVWMYAILAPSCRQTYTGRLSATATGPAHLYWGAKTLRGCSKAGGTENFRKIDVLLCAI